jgi:4-amino-4-deoxy-L-arabinose transferase-like glycosyltransferase
MKSRIIGVAIAGILLRLLMAFVIVPDQPQAEDGPSYAEQAQQILAGSAQHYYFPPGTAFVVAPMYAIAGRSVTVDHALGVVLTSGVILASVWFAVILLGWSRPTLLVAILASVYGHTVLTATQISSQPLTAISVVLAVGLTIQCLRTWSWWRWLAASAACTLAVLTRPASGVVVAGILIVLAIAAWKQRLSWTTLMGAWTMTAVVLVAAVVPVMRHNAAAGQGMTISTNNEWNLFLSNTPFTPDYKTGHFGQRTFDQIDPEAAAWLSACIPHKNPAAATLEERRLMSNAATTYMAQNPGRTLYRVSNRMRGYWGMDYTGARMLQQSAGISTKATAPLLAYEGGSYLLVILAVLAAWVLRIQFTRTHLWLISAVIIAGMLPYLVAFALPRFHLPVIPLVMPIAALALDRVLDEPRESMRTLLQSPLWWVSVIVVLALQVEHFYHLARLQ